MSRSTTPHRLAAGLTTSALALAALAASALPAAAKPAPPAPPAPPAHAGPSTGPGTHPGPDGGPGANGTNSGAPSTSNSSSSGNGSGSSSVSGSNSSSGSTPGDTTSSSGDSSEPAGCAYSVPTGFARCHAHVRTDSNARGHAPEPARIKQPAGTLGDNGAYDPKWLQSAYNDPAFQSPSLGSNQTVAIVDAYDDPNAAGDLSYYRNRFGLPACGAGCFTKVNQAGGTSPLPAADSGWGQEISLDLDMVSAMCPGCHILLVEANSNSLADLGAAVNEAVHLGADVVSNSYGGGEYTSETQDSATYYDHPGVAVVASSGDNGYGVEFPAASNYVTAVGGTSLYQNNNTGTRSATESAWSGAGSGCSRYETKPTWQTDSGCSMRTVADVSAVADPNTGVWVYDTYGNGGWTIFGGTSVASPIIGSLFAVAGALPDSGSMPPDQWPYLTPSALNDITTGSNGTCSPSYLCHAVTGFDGPTGLGTPNGTNDFSGVPPAPTAPSAPQGVKATAGNSSVTLSWSAPASSGNATLTSYTILKGTTSGGEVSIATVSASTLSYTDTAVSNGNTYYYEVKATNSAGFTSVASTEASATPGALPGAPQNLTAATSSTKGVVLNWTVGTNPGSTYMVYRGTRSGSETLYKTYTCSAATGSTCTFNDTNTKSRTVYYYEVASQNSVGTGPLSNQASAKAR